MDTFLTESRPSSSLPLLLAKGWREERPADCQQRLWWVEGGTLKTANADFTKILTADNGSTVEAPLAPAPEGGVFRYAASLPLKKPPCNEIRHYDSSGNFQTVSPLAPNRWNLWLLRYLPDPGCLIGLIASELPSNGRFGVRIAHQLGIFDLHTQRSRLVPLPADCFAPLGLCPRAKEVIFSGVSGLTAVSISGKFRWKIAQPGLSGSYGAAFDSVSNAVYLGGAPLTRLDPETREQQVLAPDGFFPICRDDGKLLAFTHSGEFGECNPGTCQIFPIVSIAASRYPEIRRIVAPALSANGRYLAVVLTRRSLLPSATAGSQNQTWSERQIICVLDFDQRRLWQHPVKHCTSVTFEHNQA